MWGSWSILGKKDKGMIIDVSHHNGSIDWKSVLTNIPKVDGVIVKCSEGATGMDPKFAINVASCISNNIKWGAYHFATWNKKPVEEDALQEAKWFISMIRSVGKMPDLPLVLDIESNTPISYTKQEMVNFVKTFTDKVKKAGYEIAIYGSPGFLNTYLPINHPFTEYPVWVADYSGSINPIPGWTKVWLHQYTQTGKVKGISGNCDLNRVINQ